MKENLLTTRGVKDIIRKRQYGWHHDGGGLYLVGSEEYRTFSWTLRLYKSTVTGKPRDLGLGSVKLFTLAEARQRARKYRQLAADGVDPIEARRKDLAEMRTAAADRMLFRDAARDYLALHKDTWKNGKHRQQWENTLRDYAYPKLGNCPLAEIDGAQISEALSPIWTSKTETAQRVKQRIERIIQWVRDGKPLPQRGASKRVRHHLAMPFAALPPFMAELRDRDSISSRALEFTILTAARTSEAIGAKWDEIDFDTGVWTVPAERMKAGKAHEVPLSKRALAILKALPREKGSPFIFPGGKAKQPLSNMAMLELLRGMQGNGFTVHGFRSTFRDWAGDRTSFARDVIEHALAHRIKDKAEAAYRRTAALEKRRKLMQAWTDYCEAPAVKGDNVRPIRGAA
jgi:integrase